MNTEGFLTYSSWILTVISIYLTIHLLERIDPQCYYQTYRNIIKFSEESELQITYKGQEVEQVSTTFVFLWNKGRKPIKKTDVYKPIRIVFPDNVAVLDFRILKVSRDAIGFNTSRIEREEKVDIFTSNNNLQGSYIRIIDDIELCFEFLAKNDGAVIEIKHTGDGETIPKIDGIILSASQEIKMKRLNLESLSRKSLKMVIKKSIKAIPSTLLIFSGTIYVFLKNVKDWNTFLAALILSSLSFTVALLIPTLFDYFKKPPFPKSLDINVNIIPYKQMKSK